MGGDESVLEQLGLAGLGPVHVVSVDEEKLMTDAEEEDGTSGTSASDMLSKRQKKRNRQKNNRKEKASAPELLMPVEPAQGKPTLIEVVTEDTGALMEDTTGA